MSTFSNTFFLCKVDTTVYLKVNRNAKFETNLISEKLDLTAKKFCTSYHNVFSWYCHLLHRIECIFGSFAKNSLKQNTIIGCVNKFREITYTISELKHWISNSCPIHHLHHTRKITLLFYKDKPTDRQIQIHQCQWIPPYVASDA